MRHPFELEKAELEALNLEFENISDESTEKISGGKCHSYYHPKDYYHPKEGGTNTPPGEMKITLMLTIGGTAEGGGAESGGPIPIGLF